MSFLEEDVGSDTISDLTSRAITPQLCRLTHDFCAQHGIQMSTNDLSVYPLPTYQTASGEAKPMVLVPRDIVRHLPVTESWSDVWKAVEHNSALRDEVNRFLGGIVKPTVTEQKEAVRRSVLKSPKIFEEFLEAVKEAAEPYDDNKDVFGFYRLRDLVLQNGLVTRTKSYDLKKGPEEVREVVLDALGRFKHHVEHGNLWELLWAGDQPKRERASQLAFYAVADAYCKAHDVDLSSEPNMGGGPVDFKFSDGYKARVVVEMKRSSGTVENGYAKQLEAYKTAADTEYGVFVIIDYGDGLRKIKRVQTLRERALARGGRASDIVVIDARKKASASKRR